MEGERKGEGRAGGGAGDSRLLHTSLTLYTHTLHAGPGPQPRRSTHGAILPRAPVPGRRRCRNYRSASQPPLPAAWRLPPPCSPPADWCHCQSRSSLGTMSRDPSALPPPQEPGPGGWEVQGPTPRFVFMHAHVCMCMCVCMCACINRSVGQMSCKYKM